MKSVNCNQCSKHLIDVPLDEPSVGFKVRQSGFVFKLPILYGGTEPLYFCDNDCQKTYYEEHFTKEEREVAKKISDDLKKDLPQMVESTHNAVKSFVDGLNKFKK